MMLLGRLILSPDVENAAAYIDLTKDPSRGPKVPEKWRAKGDSCQIVFRFRNSFIICRTQTRRKLRP